MAILMTKLYNYTIYCGMGRPREDIRAQLIPGADRYRVSFLEHPEWWFNSPCFSADQARSWARRNKDALFARHSDSLSFRKLGEGFFDEKSAWNIDQQERGRKRIEATVDIYRGLLFNHLLPALGDTDIRQITPGQIDAVIKAARLVIKRSGPLSRGTKNKALDALSFMFEYWKAQELVTVNPVDSIIRYNKAPEHPRDALPRSILPKMFPGTHGEAIRVWGSSMWASFFAIINDTGARPGEVRALRWCDIYFADRFIPLKSAVQAGTSDTIKQTKSGQRKPGYISERTKQELQVWRSETKYSDDMDFVFTRKPGTPVSATAYGDAFRAALKRLSVEGKGWTTYWIRHTFGSYSMEVLSKPEIMDLMGHASVVVNNEYRHPDDEALYKSNLAARDALDKQRKG